MKNFTGAQGAVIVRLLIESYRAKAHRILEAGFTGQKKDKLGHTRYYADGRQVKNPNAKEKSAIHAAASTSLPAGHAPSHNDAATRVDALHADTPPEHVAALANDLMKMSVEDLTKMAKGPAEEPKAPEGPPRDKTNRAQMTPEERSAAETKITPDHGIFKTKKEAQDKLNTFVANINANPAMKGILAKFNINAEDSYEVVKSKRHGGKWGLQATQQHEIAYSANHGDPVSAEAVKKFGIKLPFQYQQQGDVFVFVPGTIAQGRAAQAADNSKAAAAAPAPKEEPKKEPAAATPDAMGTDALALDALRLKANKKPHNAAHLTPDALLSLKAQGFVNDAGKLTDEGRAHLYLQKGKAVRKATGPVKPKAPTAAPAPEPEAPEEPKQKRANAGGEVGPNGEHYKGGAFIATTELPKSMKDKIKRAAGDGMETVRDLQGNATREKPPSPDMMSIMGTMLGTFINRKGEVNAAYLDYLQASPEKRKQVADLAEKYRAGENWAPINDYPDVALAKHIYRLADAGLPIAGSLLGRLKDNADFQKYYKKQTEKAAATAAPTPDEAPTAAADKPGFTGTDSQGRQWQDGELVAAKDKPTPAAPAAGMSADANALDALRLKSNKKQHNPAHISPEALTSLKAQGFIDDNNKLTNEGRAHLYSQKLTGAPAPTGSASTPPAAPKPKWKRANRNKDSLISIVKRKGGINSKSLKTDYDYQADIIEGGLLHAVRKQGMGLDEMAASLQVEGHIIVPEGVDPGDYLLERMKGRHHSALRNTDKEIESEQEAFYKAQHEAKQGGHDERSIEGSRRSGAQTGESAGQKEGATELDEWDNSGTGTQGGGEKDATVSGDGYDSADTDDYDRNAGQDGPVDNSFDFGANADEPAPAPATATTAPPPPGDAVARHMQRQAFTGVDAQGRQWQNGELVAAKDDEPAAPASNAAPEPKADEKEQPEIIGKGSTGDVTKQGGQVYKTANENESNAYSKLAGIDGVAPGKLEGDKIVTPFYKHVISVDTIPYEKRQTLGPILKPNLGRMVNAVTALSDEGLSYNDPLQFGFDKDKKSNLLDFSMAEKVDNAPRENLSALANYLKQFGLSKHGDAMTQVALVSDYITPGSRWLDDDSTDSIDGAKIESNLDGKPGKYAYYSFNARTIPGVAQTGHRDAANVIFSDKPLSNEFMETWEIHPAIHRTDAKADEPEPKAEPTPEPEKKSAKFENPGDVITPSSQSRIGENPLEVVSIKDGWAVVGYANRPDGPRVRMPSESLDLFRQDQQGRVDLPDHTGSEAIDKISNGKGKLLGSGDDGLAYDAGDKVVKVSTTAHFHAFGHEHRSPAEAVHRLKGQAEINNDMIKAGVPGLLPQTFEEHGNRGFITMEKLDTTTKLTPEQVDEVARNIEAMHKLGYVLGDQIQVGIDFAGHPKIFDTGKAVKAGSGGYSEDDHFDYDNSNLERFFKDNGLTYEDPEQKKLTKLRDSTRAQIEKIKAAPKDIDQGKAQFLLHSFSLHLNLLAQQPGGKLYALAMAHDPEVKKLELIARHTIDTKSFDDKTVKKLKPMDAPAPAAAAPDQPGFTGTDSEGREWQNGKLVAAKDEPTKSPAANTDLFGNPSKAAPKGPETMPGLFGDAVPVAPDAPAAAAGEPLPGSDNPLDRVGAGRGRQDATQDMFGLFGPATKNKIDQINNGPDGADSTPAAEEPTALSAKAPGVSLSDVPYDLAFNAHRGTSFVPEKRASYRQQSYVDQMQADWEHLSQFAKTPQQQEILKSEFAQYKAGYLARTKAQLSADSRILSPMISGPARFPTNRNNKANSASEKRQEETVEFRKRALFAAAKAINPVTSGAPVLSRDDDAIQTLTTQVERLEKIQDHYKKINAAYAKFVKNPASLATSGLSEKEQATVKAFHEGPKDRGDSSKPYPSYRLTNNGASIRRIRDRIDTLSKLKAMPEKEEKYSGGVSINHDPDDARIRIKFPGKPSPEVIKQIKSRGFIWSPTHGTWQRQLNRNGEYAADELMKALGHEKTTTEAVKPATDPHAAKIKLVQAIIARRGIKPPQPKAQAKKIPESSEDADPRVKRIRELMAAYC